MDIYEAISARRTIRDFDARSIDPAILLRILDAGMRAPSHNHLREWQFVRVESRRQRQALVQSFDSERTREEIEAVLDGWGLAVECQRAMYLDGIPKQASMLLDAGAVIIPCFRQEEPLLAEKPSLHALNAFASIWAVIENILVAAASEGIFGVTKIVSRPSETENVRAILGIPPKYEIPCYLALGYPRDDAFVAKQLSIDVTERLHIDRWSE
jgi:nitroreductase